MATTENTADRAELLAARAKQHKLRAHHHKPYRKRHILVLALTGFFLALIVLQIGIMVGRSDDKDPKATIPAIQPAQVIAVRSAEGFAFAYNQQRFDSVATTPAGPLSFDQLADGKSIVTTTLKPVDGSVPPAYGSSRLYVEIKPDVRMSSLSAKQTQNPLQSVESLFPVASNADFRTQKISESATSLGGVAALQTVYELTPNFGGGKTYTVSWAAVANDKPMIVRVQGLFGSAIVPTLYQEVIDTVTIRGDQVVAGVQTVFADTNSNAKTKTLELPTKYLADYISPSVVKIYQLICGTLVVSGNAMGQETCDAMTGSGFIVSNDGYIATNGHVVLFSAKDAFANALIKSPNLFDAYLKGIGLNQAQIAAVSARPDLQAAIIAKVYELPDSEVFIRNERQATFVALANDPVRLQTPADISAYISAPDTLTIKRARLAAANYNAKDLYVVQSGAGGGFSSSDIALIKTDVTQAPALPFVSDSVTQSERISLFGFPGDAENQLVSQDRLSVSVTSGSISSIREAVGGVGRLYQSDADASQGSSGGPAINQNGEVIGLLTYRFASASQSDAAKSYIRAISDITQLAQSNKITLATDSQTRETWAEGLALVSESKHSAAIKKFQAVKDAYPAHRLAAGYVTASEQAIRDGKNIVDVPNWLYVLLIISLGTVMATTIIIIARHHAHHKLYVTGSHAHPRHSAVR